MLKCASSDQLVEARVRNRKKQRIVHEDLQMCWAQETSPYLWRAPEVLICVHSSIIHPCLVLQGPLINRIQKGCCVVNIILWSPSLNWTGDVFSFPPACCWFCHISSKKHTDKQHTKSWHLNSQKTKRGRRSKSQGETQNWRQTRNQRTQTNRRWLINGTQPRQRQKSSIISISNHSSYILLSNDSTQ